MAVWKDCPPYYVPDTGMGLFILYTTFAMMYRFVPRALVPTSGLRPWPHMSVCLIFIVMFNYMLFNIVTWFFYQQ